MGREPTEAKQNLINFSGRRKLSLVLQSEAAECGLACLSMVAAYHGRRQNMASLRRLFSVSIKGATLQQLMEISDRLGFAPRPLRLELEALQDLETPCILHWDLNHFVVLKEAKRNHITVHDPAFGIRRFTYDEASSHFTGIALELTPTSSFEKKEAVERVRIWDFWDQIRGLKRSLIQIFMLSVLLQAFALATPFYSQLVIDDAVTKGDMNFLHVLVAGFAMLLFIEILVGVLRSYISVRLNHTLSFQMETNLFRHLIRLPTEWFEKRHIGDISSRFASLEPVQKLITGGMVAAILDGFMALATLTMMYIYSWQLATMTVVGLLLYFIGRLIVFPWVRRKNEENINLDAKLESTFLESIRAIRAIKIFSREQDRQADWQNAYADVVNNTIQIQQFEIKADIGEKLVFGGLRLLILYVGASLVIAGEFSLGMLFAFQAYQGNFTTSTQGLITKIMEWRMVGLHLERLADIVHAQKEEGSESKVIGTRRLEGKIELQDVSFRYAEHEPYIFEKINLVIEPGECVALIGPSGGGKSTLLKVILGLLQPTEGQVLVDGIPINQFGLKSLRAQIGVVMQDDQLLSGSLAENITFFDHDVDLERVELVAAAACIHDDIAQMPMGYQSLVGDMGSSLSGGQKQRVMLARALYRNPRMLFLDEGTANLDEQTEARVNKVIESLPSTRVLIAHRPGMIRIADKIALLEEGDLRVEYRQREIDPFEKLRQHFQQAS